MRGRCGRRSPRQNRAPRADQGRDQSAEVRADRKNRDDQPDPQTQAEPVAEDGPGWTRGNPYSLSAAPDGRSLRITAESVGASSARLTTLRPGTRVLVEGPYGRLHTGVRTSEKAVLIGAGIGITPLRAILEELPASPDGVVVIYRVGQQSDIVLAGELLDLTRAKGGRVVAVVGHRNRDRESWLPVDSRHLGDAEALTRIVPDIAQRDVFVCGNPAWMDTVIAAAHEAGVPRDAVHHERFSY